MKRYIDKDDALKSVSWDTEAYQSINMIPAADVVEVVRCKYCKYGDRLIHANGYISRICTYPFGHGLIVEEDGFCKYGERREDA